MLPLVVGLAVLLAAGVQGCGPTYDHLDHNARAKERLRRSAVKVVAPDLVTLQAGVRGSVILELRVKPGFYLPAHAETNPGLLALWVEPPTRAYLDVGVAAYPPGVRVDLPKQRQPVLSYADTTHVGIPLTVHANTGAIEQRLPFVVHFQVCTVHGCEVPERRTVRVAIRVVPAARSGDAKDLL